MSQNRETVITLLDYYLPLILLNLNSQIKLFVEAVGKQFPGVCRVFSLGRSSEGRELVAIKFSVNGTAVDDGEVGGKPALLIDAGIHAREWVAPLTALYMIKQLAENATNHQLFQDIDIYIAPLLNPDGYEFSHMNTSVSRQCHGYIVRPLYLKICCTFLQACVEKTVKETSKYSIISFTKEKIEDTLYE